MKKLFFLAVLFCLLAGIFLPGIFLDKKSGSDENKVHAVSKKYLSSSAAMARSASLNLKGSERLELVAGKWESDTMQAETYEMAQSDYEAVMLAKEGLKKLYEKKLYPLDMDGYGRWYSWEAFAYKAVDTTFHTYTAFYWVIKFQKYDGTDIHEVRMLDDGTIFMAYASQMSGFDSSRLRLASDVMGQEENVTIEDGDGFEPAMYRNLDITAVSTLSECAYSEKEDYFFIRQSAGKDNYLYLLFSGKRQEKSHYKAETALYSGFLFRYILFTSGEYDKDTINVLEREEEEMKRKQVYAFILAAALVLTAGCSKKAEEIPQNTKETTEGTAVDSKDVTAIFQGVEDWKEEFTIKSGEKEKTVKIEAPVSVADSKNIVVIEGHVIEFDEPFKEKMANILFGNTGIYPADDEHKTKEDLKERIENLEQRVNALAGAEDRETVKESEKQSDILKKCRSYLPDAKERYTETAAGFEDSHYVAKRDGIWYKLDFQNPGEENYFWNGYDGAFSFEPRELKDAVPDSVLACDYAEINPLPITAWEKDNNQCKYSLEEAREIASAFLKEAGLANAGITEEENAIEWSGWNRLDEGASRGTGSEINGWQFQVRFFNDGEILNGGESIGGKIIVSDAGIVSADFNNPIVIEKISEKPKLLSLSQIKEGIRQELKTHSGSYFQEEEYGADSIKFEQLKLCLLPERSEKEPGKISFLPIWKLAGAQWTGYNIYINAIDGSVVSLENLRAF